MAVAAPARKTAPAPPPSRTAPPRRKAAAAAAAAAAPAAPARRKAAPGRKAAPARTPRTRPKPKGRAVAAPAPAPARKAPARKPARKAPARAPRRAAPKTKRSVGSVGGQLIPFAGRTAVAVGQLPDSGLVVRMTRGRLWIGVLGVLLAGIVALNVVTLSFAASSGQIDAQLTALEQENPILSSREARVFGIGPVRQAAGEQGMAMPSSETIHFTDAGHGDAAVAAQRLAAISPG
jgi:hypothetical protein